MNSRQKLLKQLITRARSPAEAIEHFDRQPDPAVIKDSINRMLAEVPPTAGHCVLLSSAWASLLKENYAVPAIVVAGELAIGGVPVFSYKEKLPTPTRTGKVSSFTWRGHCWIEIGGWIGDLSILRTSRATKGPNRLSSFVASHFGAGKGAFFSAIDALPPGIRYKPKEVLSDIQVEAFTDSLFYQLENGLIETPS